MKFDPVFIVELHADCIDKSVLDTKLPCSGTEGARADFFQSSK